jgi:tetratricopeptide (TPR) repeat protein
LRQDASTKLAQQLIESQGTSAPDTTLDWCVSVSEGNPYYLRELLTHWLETREPYGVPRSLMQLIERRLEGLGRDATRTFQVCVALGTLSTVARLEKLQIMDPPRLFAALEELAIAGLVKSDGSAILPKHDLLAQASKSRLAATVSSVIHRRIASVLETESKAEPLPSTLWDCAHHWELAAEPSRALEFLRHCGEHLLSVGLPEEAVGLFRRAIGMEPATPQQRLQLHRGLITALRQCGLLSQVQKEIKALRESALRMGQVLPIHSELEHLEVEAGWRINSHDVGIADQLKSCLVATDASVAHRLHAGFWLLAIAHSVGDRSLAYETWQRAEPLMLNTGSTVARYQLGMVFHTDYGDLEKAVHYSRLLVEAARQTNDTVGLHRTLRNASLALRRAGYLEEARSRLYEAMDLATKHHATLNKVETAHALAGIALEEGDISSAGAWIGRCDEWLSGWESPLQEADLAIVRARIKLSLGDLHGAKESAARLPSWQGLRSAKLAQAIASVHLSIAVRSNDSGAIDALVPPLTRFYDTMGDLGHQDFAIEALTRASIHLERCEEAKRRLQDYVNIKRRDRSTLPPSLLDLARELSVSGNRD